MDPKRLFVWVENDETYLKRRVSLDELVELVKQAGKTKAEKKQEPKEERKPHIYPDD